MTPLRLLAVIEAHTITGPAKNLLDFAAGAREHGVETTLATFVRGAGPNLFVETAQARGLAIETIPEAGAFDRAAIAGLRALVARVAPAIVQTHAVKSHFLARLAGVHHRAKWIAFHHGYTWPTLRARVYNQLDRWSLGAPHHILTVSQPFRDELAARGAPRDRIEVIHNAIRPGWGAARDPELRARLGIPAGRKVILIVGRLSREKDHLALVDAVATLREHDPHLLVIGEGPERPRIEARIAALQLGGRVTLAGQAPSAEPFYGIADLAVLSSLSEGSPNALLEAMSAGVPAVATRVGGIPEIVAHEEQALLVPPADSAALAAAMGRLLADPGFARSLAARARERVLERHTPEARIRTLAAIYQRVSSLP